MLLGVAKRAHESVKTCKLIEAGDCADSFPADSWHTVDAVIRLIPYSRKPTDGNLDEAWEAAKTSLQYRDPRHRAMDFFYIYECFAPRQVRVSTTQTYQDGGP